MHEKGHISQSYELPYSDKIGETTVSQMDGFMMEVPELAALAIDGSFSEEDSLALAEWARENKNDFKEILTELNYSEAKGELSEAMLKRLELCLRTPGYFVASRIKHRTKDNRLTPELIEYNQVLRDAVKLNPDLQTMDSLQATMLNTVVWAELPLENRESYSRISEATINGVRAELVMEQLLTQSTAAKNARITYRPATTLEDKHGFDCLVTYPVVIGSEIIVVPVGLDVKFNPKRAIPHNQNGIDRKFYTIEDDEGDGIKKAKIWAGTTEEGMKGRLLLQPDEIETKGEAMTLILRNVAEDIIALERRKTISRGLGRRVIKTA